MKRIFVLFFFAFLYGISYSQCPNANFSAGSISGNWSGSTGHYTSLPAAAPTAATYVPTGGLNIGVTNANTFATDTGRQTLITQSQTDPETQNMLNEMPPTGGYAVRLGNPRTAKCAGGVGGTYGKEQQLSYTYTPTSSSCIFTYQYAVVLHDPGNSNGHGPYTRPAFFIKILNSSGALIDSTCGYYSVTAVSGIPGFVECLTDPNDNCDHSSTDSVLWKNWTSVSVDLTSQIGSQVTINFATRDCNPNNGAGSHFGYAYLTCNCGAFTLTQQCVGTSDSVVAPAGYASYQWSYKNTSGTTVNTNTGGNNYIVVSPVPNGNTITCTCTSVTGCTFVYTLPLSIDIPVFTPAAPTICEGAVANITASGNGPYTYHWSTGANVDSISVSPTSTTSYSVTATAPGGCTSTASVPVTVNPNPAGTTNSTPATCGNNNGTITVSLSAGTSPYTYDWSTTPAQTTATASNLGAGNYIVTVTDANSCSATITGTVTSPSGITIDTSSTPSYCGNPDGTATVIATGGSGPLSYTWSSVPVQTTPAATGLAAGTYTVTVTDGVCPVTATFVIKNIAGPSVQVMSVTAETCSLGNGSAGIMVVSGTPPFTYSWSNTSQTSDTLVGLSAGTYAVTVTDKNHCTAFNTLTITNSPPPIVTVGSLPSTCNLPNGSIYVVVDSGGTPPFTYSWNPSSATTDSVANITGGTTYNVTVTDAIGCTAISSGTPPNIPGPLINGIPQSETCAGLSNGYISITITDPATPYTYKWSTGATTQNILNLPGSMTYTVTVTDGAGCTNTDSLYVGTHPIITLNVSSTNSHCGQADGSVSLLPGGGTPPFTYIWSNNATTQNLNNVLAGVYTVTVTDGFCTSTATESLISLPGPTVSIPTKVNETCSLNNGSATAVPAGGASPIQYAWNTVPSQNTPTATGLQSGNYIVTITDANGCTATNVVVITNSTPPVPSLLNTVPANCGFSNGDANISVTGGTPPMQYNWNTSPSQTTQNISAVSSGTYTVTITDANNCTATIQAVINPLSGPSVAVTGSPEICDKGNGLAKASAYGGHGAPYTYHWSNNDTTATDTGLTKGTYTVTISDGGCSATNSVTISNIPGPNAYFIYNPKILTFLDGPVGFYDQSTGSVINWQWSLGDGSDTSSVTQFWHQYNGIGTYLVTLVVTDTNGCKSTITDTVIVKDIYTFYVPNAFTPHGTNPQTNVFSPQGSNIDPNHYNEYIYDRWGNLVFQTNEWDISTTKPPEGQAKAWNGTINNNGNVTTDVVMDVYVYKIIFREFSDGPEHEFVGSITLVP